ncbi:MAG: glutamate-5-semialdehyde dehydrogenase [Chitinophagaceae bacterium]
MMSKPNEIIAALIKTRKAGIALRDASDETISAVLNEIAELVQKNEAKLLKVNATDVARQAADNPKVDRLRLTRDRLNGIANALRNVATLKNPVGNVLSRKTLPNKLKLEKVTVPLGVVCAIYESRPNVTYDIAALCLKSRNACVLKGSGDAENSNHAAVMLIKRALRNHHLPSECVLLLPSDRSVLTPLLKEKDYIDIVIPRGSNTLIEFVRKNSDIPLIETGAGVCHVYVHEKADLGKALNIVENAKVSRPSVCNAMDTVIVDQKIAKEFLPRLAERFAEHHVELLADNVAYSILKGYPQMRLAKSEDFATEFLSLKAGVKVVKDIDSALAHIAHYSTKHSEAIVSEDKEVCERFLREVDAAAVYSNASTRFTDGEEFGLGAEIGISTQKLHARGPFALEKLVTEKWVLRGNGQVR